MKASTTEPMGVLDPTLVLQKTQGAEGEEQSKEVWPEGTSHLAEDTTAEGQFDDPPKMQP